MKKRIVVVCPGRGSYTKENLGYLKDRPQVQKDIQLMDSLRKEINEPTITELDSSSVFKTSLHTKGEHASPLIYSCALADFLSIDQSRYEIVAIAGNSMGWYLSLAFSGALNKENSFKLIQTMGSMMKGKLIGGQIIYPIIDENWSIDTTKLNHVYDVISQVNRRGEGKIYISIFLGGYVVLAGEQTDLSIATELLTPVEHYPFQLINHGAFHTPLLNEVSQKAFQILPESMFQKPKIPLVDGRGTVWQPYSTQTKDLYQYTLGHQVYELYDFTQSITVALKEFAPDHLVLLGPGNSLGGAIGQILIKNKWQGILSKSDFSERQKSDPFLLSMGLQQQQALLQERPAPVALDSVK